MKHTYCLKLFFFLLLAAYTRIGFSQNLVSNPGFEQVVNCDSMTVAKFGTAIDTSETNFPFLPGWFNSSYGAADIFHSCWPFTVHPAHHPNIPFTPRTGNGYIGLFSYVHFVNWTPPPGAGQREYIQTKLLKPMQAGCVYEVSFYTKLENDPTRLIGYAIENMGLYISVDRPADNYQAPMPVTPQIANPAGRILGTTYTKISGLYTALGGEKYITIGNFVDDLNTVAHKRNPTLPPASSYCYYLIDDVSVIPVTAADYSLNIGPDTVYCDNQPINQTLTAPYGFAAYEWSTGDTTASIQVTQPGTYWVNADFGCGFLTDTIRIDTKPSFIEGFELGNDTVICAQGPFRLPLRTKRGFTTYRWNTGDTTQNIFVTAPGTYFVTATYDCGTISDTIKIGQFQPTRLFSFSDTVLCAGESANLMPASGFASYQWASGETSQNLTVSQVGKYKVTATTAAGCSVSDSVTVRFKEPVLSFSLGKDTVLCEKESLEIDIKPQAGITYLWNDGVKTASRSITEAGVYKLTASDRCSSFSEEIEVKFRDCTTIFVPNLITPNHDGHNDFLEIATPTNRNLDLKIYNRWGVLVYEKQDYKNNWPSGKISSGTYYYLLSDPELNKTYKGWLEVAQ